MHSSDMGAMRGFSFSLFFILVVATISAGAFGQQDDQIVVLSGQPRVGLAQTVDKEDGRAPWLTEASTIACAIDGKVVKVTNPIDFQVMLDVEELTEASYEGFITNLRRMLAAGGSQAGGVPILPHYGEDKTKVHFFDVVVSTKSHRTTLRLRRDDIYVLGYLIHQSNKWVQFADPNNEQPTISPNKPHRLPFTGSYDQMEKYGVISITSIRYSKLSLSNAVATLAKPINKNKGCKDQARALIFMCQKISEAARFKDIFRIFESQLVQGFHLSGWMEVMEKDWDKYCSAVQCYYKYKSKYKYNEIEINGAVYKTADDLRAIFGMMKLPKLDEASCGIKKLSYEDETACRRESL